MFSALFKAVAQLADPALRRVVALGVVGALAIAALLNGTAWWLLSHVQMFEGWAETAADWVGGALVVVVTIVLFPAFATIVMGVFLEDVAEAVEARHYPALPAARARPLVENLGTTLRFALVSLAVNLMALPFYLLLLASGLGILAFYAVNGYLLGREYYELVALRRLAPAEAGVLRRAHRGRLWLAGAGITFLLSLPVINLLAPVAATAFMVHMFQSLRPPRPLV